MGARVALVAHGYRAKAGEPREVHARDRLEEVGDEALACARVLARSAPVVVAASRQAALDHATTLADVVVLDGVLQTRPRPASLALLALDGESPWGAGEVVPRGDLRARPEALLAASDGTVVLCDEAPLGAAILSSKPRWSALVHSRGAYLSGVLVPWESLSRLRVGLFVALARPGRLLASLARRGVVPYKVVRLPDHGDPAAWLSSLRSDPSVELWLASPKCALHLETRGIPHAVLDHSVELGAEFLRVLAGAVGSTRRPASSALAPSDGPRTVRPPT
jgi:tetraacyldisaccharide-1-P 4'-kinase